MRNSNPALGAVQYAKKTNPPLIIPSLIAHIKLAALGAVGVAIFYVLADAPYLAILMVNFLFCGHLASLFRTKYKYLFFIQPIVLFVSSQLFTSPFLEAGDGEIYQIVVSQYLNTSDFIFDGSNLMDSLGVLEFLKYASLGVAPTFAVPEFFFNAPEDAVYYLWQGTFHVILCAFVITLASTWKVLHEKYLFTIALFAAVSPSFFDLGVAPTRHVVTFFGVFLLCITHLALMQRLTFGRVIWFVFAIFIVLISKAPLLLPYMIFVAFDLFVIQRIKVNLRVALLAGVLIVGILLLGVYLYQTTLAYAEAAKEGAATFSAFAQVPVFGWLVKYVYALLAPFPWSEAPLFIATNYAGNWLLFLFHVLSSLIGVYLFLVVVLKWRAIWASDVELKQMVTYALILSLSILRGSTGFHTYLLIYFPMLSPLLAISRCRISPLLALGLVVLLEMAVIASK